MDESRGEEAGLIDASSDKTTSGLHCFAFGLTWNGHEFLDRVRDQTIWNKVKAAAREKGLTLSFDVIKALATKVIGVTGFLTARRGAPTRHRFAWTPILQRLEGPAAFVALAQPGFHVPPIGAVFTIRLGLAPGEKAGRQRHCHQTQYGQ